MKNPELRFVEFLISFVESEALSKFEAEVSDEDFTEVDIAKIKEGPLYQLRQELRAIHEDLEEWSREKNEGASSTSRESLPYPDTKEGVIDFILNETSVSDISDAQIIPDPQREYTWLALLPNEGRGTALLVTLTPGEEDAEEVDFPAAMRRYGR